ncbi:4-hydroxy-tetrahydrodipicolinate synthase [Phaeospirillum tilakii]|uniref:4-hydroxy-tetrahydrodipicolinate synthase n=1 Tax=Phaeospirillum tilakii TaxID=741673 RepID=A0ABW5C5Q1_9PROT
MSSNRLDHLGGSMVALVTPFTDGRVDEEAFLQLCERQIRAGSSALVPCGTTGEAPTLSHAEQIQIIGLAVRAARGRVPVIAGAGSNCTATTIELVRHAEMLGADAALCITPYYNRPSQEGLFRHFEAVQASTTLPIILYDVPKRTGITLELETIVRLAQLPNIAGLKDASGDMAKAGRVRYSVPPEFLRLCGDDDLVADHLALGSQGCISVIANVVPALCAALHQAWAAHEYRRTAQLAHQLAELNTALFVESNPVPVKWALARLGQIKGELRLPLTSLQACHEQQVQRALQAILPAEAQAAIGVERFAAVA